MALLDEEKDRGFVLLETQRPLQPTGRLDGLGILKSVKHIKLLGRTINTMVWAVEDREGRRVGRNAYCRK